MFSSFFLKDRFNIYLCLLVFLISLVVYLLTMAPTASFWDCGEFIACSYILGIPHPPGTPLFILIGRVFALFPFFEIAVRINFISALFSALTVALSYLVIVRIASKWFSSDNLWNRVGRYTGGIVGSFMIAFSSTFWSNAVEAEVYGLSMFLSVFLLYLALLWVDKKDSKRRDMILVLIAYIGILSLGIHMTTFLIMPVIFLLVLLYDKDKLKDFRFWITGLILSLVMYAPLEYFLVALFGWLIFSLLMLSLSKVPSRWIVIFLITLSGAVGYSVQLYIPIRSSLNPAIDENNPHDWKTFSAFLERKQYGREDALS